MSTTSSPSPRLGSSGINSSVSKPSEQTRWRSRRKSLIKWSPNSILDDCITHVDVFLGSLTDISEQLACSLAESARHRGAEVTMKSLEKFQPDQYLDRNSALRTSSRLTVFVVSTHVAGKPSPSAEMFLQWLRETPTKVNSSVTTSHPEAKTPPQNSHQNSSPRKLQLTSSKPERSLQRHNSLTDALLRFRVNLRRPFRGGESQTTATAHNTEGPLQGVQYAVFGVGNSIYRTYNATAKYIDTRLQELGGVRACHVELGDLSNDIDIVFAKWEARLLQTVSSQQTNTYDGIPVTTQKMLKPLSRSSLPCVTGVAGISITEIMAEEPAMNEPSFADLEISRAGISQQGHKSKHRRYSSATSIIRGKMVAGRGTFALPPLKDHFP